MEIMVHESLNIPFFLKKKEPTVNLSPSWYDYCSSRCNSIGFDDILPAGDWNYKG